MLNIYSPEFPHEPAYIAGDREGLQKLKAAIEHALEHGKSQTLDFDSDGEGFALFVIEDPAIATRQAPYLDPHCESPSWSGPWGEITEVWLKSYDSTQLPPM